MSQDSRDGENQPIGWKSGHSVTSKKKRDSSSNTYNIISTFYPSGRPTKLPTFSPSTILSSVDAANNSRPTTIFGPPSLITNEDTHVIVVSILIGLIVALCCVLIVVAVPMIRDTVRPYMPINHRRLKRRYETVDGWLITKAAVEHDDSTCSSVSTTINHGSHTPECMICMEEFAVGDKVSWSPSEDCNHVFHKDCIREWLISHVGCPYCRTCMLPVDSVEKVDTKVLREMGLARKKTFKSTFYCLSHGLVTNNKKISGKLCSSMKEMDKPSEAEENNSSFETCSCTITTDSESENIEKSPSLRSCISSNASDQEVEEEDLEAGNIIAEEYITNNKEVPTPHFSSTTNATEYSEVEMMHSNEECCASRTCKSATTKT